MQVQSFDPNQIPAVTLTEAALEHLRQKISQGSALGIRLSVKESGCSGYMYVLDLAQQVDTNDLYLQPAEDVNLYIAPQALNILGGTEIDYVKEGINRVLKFRNPNVTAECGCGESFVVAAS